jgi:hypothetical protein
MGGDREIINTLCWMWSTLVEAKQEVWVEMLLTLDSHQIKNEFYLIHTHTTQNKTNKPQNISWQVMCCSSTKEG